jgi:iron-sulfur cluster insertion protein
MTGITVSSLAASKITEELSKYSKQETGLRVYVQGGGCSGFQYGLIVEEGPGVGDQVFDSNGIKLYVDPISVRYLKGRNRLDRQHRRGRFTIRNPNAKSTCGVASRSRPTEDLRGLPGGLAVPEGDCPPEVSSCSPRVDELRPAGSGPASGSSS